MLRLYKWIAARSGAERNISDFAMHVELSRPTVSDYLDELHEVFLIEPLSPWHSSADRRSLERPRYHVVDPAFAASFAGLHDPANGFSSQHGPALEAFVVCELRRLLGWSSLHGELFHWRKDRNEVDVLLEDGESGKILAIEVEAARESDASLFRGIEAFRRNHPRRNVRGLVIHCGDEVRSRGPQNWAVPLSALWTIGRTVGGGDQIPTSLADALQAARSQITGWNHFVPVDQKQEWSSQLHNNLERTVVPLVRQVGDLLEEAGFQVDIQTDTRPQIGATVTPRSAVEIEQRRCVLTITDDRQPSPTIGWNSK